MLTAPVPASDLPSQTHGDSHKVNSPAYDESRVFDLQKACMASTNPTLAVMMQLCRSRNVETRLSVVVEHRDEIDVDLRRVPKVIKLRVRLDVFSVDPSDMRHRYMIGSRHLSYFDETCVIILGSGSGTQGVGL